MVTYKDITENEELKTYIKQADKALGALGFTEHSFAHITRCANVAAEILQKTGYDERTIELVKIAGYMHDIGNIINRIDHAQSGAVMAFMLLQKMNMEPVEIARIISAIGNHDEETAFPGDELSAALILADKSDVRRSRVRNSKTTKFDIHWRVNYAVEKSELIVDKENKKMVLRLQIDSEISKVSEYFEIFLARMLLCRRSAHYFGFEFELNINGSQLM